jgi:hypothetical protein
MQGMLGGGLLVVAFLAVAAVALVVTVRLFRISQPPRGSEPGGPGQPKAGAGA